MDPTGLLLSITLAEDGAPPTEFRILPKGKTETMKGDVLFTDSSAASVMRAFAEHGADLMLDYGHGAFNPYAPPDAAGKAAGWFKPAVREGELWATEVEWTPAADKALRDREFRYFSPALRLSSQTREVTRLLNVALTNMPATKNLPALMASENSGDHTMPDDKPTESEVAILAALKALKVDNISAALGAITALSETAAKVPGLEARIAEFEKAEKKGKVATLLAAAKEDGRVAESEMVNLAEAGERDPAWLEGYLKNKPKSAVAEPEKKAPEGGKLIKLSATQRKVARQMGVSEEKFIETQNAIDEHDARQREEAEAS